MVILRDKSLEDPCPVRPYRSEAVLGVLVLVLLFTLALLAGVLGGVVGTGSSMVLLPALVFFYGPRVAVPIMAVAAVLGNVGRVLAWWRRIDWRPVVAYALPGIPSAVLGAHTLLTIPPRLVDGFLAVFFVAMVPLRRFAARAQWRIRLWHMGIAGAGIGFLTGMILSTGPLSVPIFTAYGLTGGAFLGSEAASALLLYAGKLATFEGAGVLSTDVLARGVVIGAAVMAGSFLARRILRNVTTQRYGLLIDVVLVTAALGMSISALR
nr:sulfite exporter TauE/SafE family protein [Actinopolymorpha pittospori]